MSATARVTRLRDVPLFADLTDEALERVASVATEVEFREGSVLIECDEPGSGLFVILDGTVRVELPLRDLEYEATDVRCVEIRRSEFLELLEAEPRLAVALLGVLARRLVAATAGERPRSAWM